MRRHSLSVVEHVAATGDPVIQRAATKSRRAGDWSFDTTADPTDGGCNFAFAVEIHVKSWLLGRMTPLGRSKRQD